MKKLVLTLTATLACVAAFAQGKISFANDSVHLIYYSNTGTVLAGDTAGAAVAVSGLTAAGDALSADLFYGTSAGSLSLLSTTTVAGGSGTPGVYAAKQVAGLTAGANYFFQVQVYDSTKATSYANAASQLGVYYGESAVFTANASSSIQITSLITHASPSSSTWTDGTTPVTGSLAGAMGAIPIAVATPEPTSLALLGLGAASLMIFRRRK